jgi:hypothetical protein
LVIRCVVFDALGRSRLADIRSPRWISDCGDVAAVEGEVVEGGGDVAEVEAMWRRWKLRGGDGGDVAAMEAVWRGDGGVRGGLGDCGGGGGDAAAV